VAYREAITKPVRVEGRFVRQTGGHGQYGHVWLQLEPEERGAGASFVDGITGAVIPRQYIPAVEAGVKQALDNGPLAGYPLVDLKVTLVDGSYHTVDSSEMAFRSAAMIAMREGTRKAAPVLQEPIFAMEIATPGEFLSEVLSDLGGRRAQVRSIEGLEDLQTVSVMIPLGETFAYTTALRSLTRGRASYTMEFRHYEPVPENMLRNIANIR
jgi:elongation factor G